jgi:parvulin-like peptidyl-prolyl isomerase
MGKSSNKRQAAAPKQPPATALTKKQIARSRKEQKQLRIIWLSVAAVAVVVLAVLTFALVRELVVTPNAPVAIVDGNKVSVSDYQALLTYRRYSLHNNISALEYQLQTMDQTSQENQFLVSFYQQQAQQLQLMLDQASQDTLDELIENELIRQKAGELALSVTPAEVEQKIQDDLQNSFSSTSSSAVTSTTPISTPTPIPQETLDEHYQQVITGMTLTDKEFRRLVGRSLLRTKVQEVLASQVVTTGLVAHVQLIQADSQEAADAAQKRIEAGEDFAAVAKEVSTDTQTLENGGDMGWVTTGQLGDRYGTDLDNFVFSLEVGKIGTVTSNDKFYVILVSERDENGPLPEEALATRRTNALTDWLTEQQTSLADKIERVLKPSQIPPDPFVSTSQG